MLFGREFSESELRRHCGSTRQLARITPYTLRDGREEGVHALDFHTASGFNFTVLPSRGMDIAFAEFRGHNLVWHSPTGIPGPQYFEPAGLGFMRTFFGGLLTTCGLLNVGVPDTWRGEPLGQHGRISNLPAVHVSHDVIWVDDDLYLLARGEVREVFPPLLNLVLRRRIRCRAGDHFLTLHDTVTNEGFERVPHQILYHVNAGFPVLNRTSHLVSTTRTVTPRDADAEENKEHFRICSDPTPGFRPEVFYHEMLPTTDGRAWAALINPDLEGGLGLYVKYDPKVLPLMTQWKMMAEGTYVMGMEPCNSVGLPMAKQQALGILHALEPGQSVDYHLEIGVLAGPDEVAAFEREVSLIAPVTPDYHSALA